MKNTSYNKMQLTVMSACLVAVIAGVPALTAQEAATPPTNKIKQLESENDDLRRRLDALEHIVQKEGLAPSCGAGDAATPGVKALSDITLSGFVQASYFYNLRKPADGQSDAYLFNTADNSFSINKVKVTLASKPVATDKWDAGFRTSLLWGEDSAVLNSPAGGGAAPGNTGFQDLREAYVELNVPIGTGLNVKVGELISLLNYESGDGGAANQNFSQGNQWWFTGNGPSAGIQLGYNLTEKVGLTLRVDNGLFQGPVDNNEGKAFSGSLAFKPSSKFWMTLIGWYEDATGGTTTAGGGAIGGYQVSEKLGTGFEVDYFNFDSGASSADLWSVGGWLWYDFTPKAGLALRADYIKSPDGVLGPAVRPGAGIVTSDTSGDLGSITLTLNLKPAPNIRIQPEIRYDYTGFSGGLDGKKDRFIVGAGVSYLF